MLCYPPHHVSDEVDEEVLYQAALPHLPLLLGGGGAGHSRGGEEAEAQENGLEVTLSSTSFTYLLDTNKPILHT